METKESSCARNTQREINKRAFESIDSLMRADSPSTLKRRRLTTIDHMESQFAAEKLAAAKQNYGRDIRVFETTTSSHTSNEPINEEEPDEFFEFTAEDYYRILATKKEDKVMKTKKLREAEEATRRSRITKAVIRVRFPDNHTLEATFHPSETMQNLVDLLIKVVARPDLPFHIFTTPPKKLIKDMSQDFYSAGFAPGAIVYFSYDQPKGDGDADVAFLKEEVMALKGLELVAEPEKPTVDQLTTVPVVAAAPPSAQERKPAADKKMVKPKWLKINGGDIDIFVLLVRYEKYKGLHLFVRRSIVARPPSSSACGLLYPSPMTCNLLHPSLHSRQ
ncbi:unnamed protein product [Lactuca saligna]|uniref:UBX domain-containing protein n=1 Tax=Lactuca saligna TaxID=75948 RepID=A0AA35YNF6_LACSI|nr:unnamed protein product [Lactuca saligna]